MTLKVIIKRKAVLMTKVEVQIMLAETEMLLTDRLLSATSVKEITELNKMERELTQMRKDIACIN